MDSRPMTDSDISSKYRVGDCDPDYAANLCSVHARRWEKLAKNGRHDKEEARSIAQGLRELRESYLEAIHEQDCDCYLCGTSYERDELIPCPECEEMVCSDCWSDEEYRCWSCCDDCDE